MKTLGYSGKICVVTGAASGIGKALTASLLEEGAEVYALDRNPLSMEGVAAFIPCDLAKKESIDEAFQKIPERIDCFFGVAGLSGSRTSYYTTFRVNFTANFYLTKEYLEKRMKQGGAIAYVSSVGGQMWEKYQKEFKKGAEASTYEEVETFMKKVSPKDGYGIMAYTLSKRMMNYFTVLEALALQERGIRVNALLPGSTDTGMKKEFEKMAGGEKALLSNNGVGRLATPEEMAEPLLYLNSSLASFVSGQLLVADMGEYGACLIKKKKNQLNVKSVSWIYNTKAVQKIFAEKSMK